MMDRAYCMKEFSISELSSMDVGGAEDRRSLAAWNSSDSVIAPWEGSYDPFSSVDVLAI